jgi:hypothetical protein
MFGIFLWVLILIIWISNLILRSTTLKGSNGNKVWICVAIFWIIFALVNIFGRISTLDNNQTTVDSVEITTEEQTSSGEELYCTEDTVY